MEAMEFTPWRRDVADVKNTFSSWDQCMQKAYCKWPAIVGIVVGSLVLIGIAWCIIGCLCCGYTCCKGCCSCCSCCCPSGSHGNNKRSKYADDTAYQNPNFGYQPSAPPTYQPPNNFQSPSYAQFDVPTSRSPRVKDDALPPMPTWESASTRRIDDSNDLEMNRLDPSTGQAMGTVPRSNRGGYYEVPNSPSSPTFAPAGAGGYRGMEATHHNINRTPSPAIGVARSISRTQSPGIGIARTQSPALPPLNTAPYGINRTASPGIGVARTSPGASPYVEPTYGPNAAAYANMRSYNSSPAPISPPPQAASYSPYPPRQAQTGGPGGGGYVPYSPTIPSSPPPPFSSVQGDSRQQETPSLLQAGRKPVEHSWKDV